MRFTLKHKDYIYQIFTARKAAENSNLTFCRAQCTRWQTATDRYKSYDETNDIIDMAQKKSKRWWSKTWSIERNTRRELELKLVLNNLLSERVSRSTIHVAEFVKFMKMNASHKCATIHEHPPFTFCNLRFAICVH